MITRTWAVLPLIAGTVFGADVIRVGSAREPTVAVTMKTLGAAPPVSNDGSATRSGIGSPA